MKAAVERDNLARKITIKVVDGPILDVSESWHTKPRRIRVERITITIFNGETTSMVVTGGIVLKSGAASTGQRGQLEWSAQALVGSQLISRAPAWAQLIWRQAPVGETYWSLEVAA